VETPQNEKGIAEGKSLGSRGCGENGEIVFLRQAFFDCLLASECDSAAKGLKQVGISLLPKIGLRVKKMGLLLLTGRTS
jgi:hypothetical protein